MFEFKPDKRTTTIICVVFVVAMLACLSVAGDWKSTHTPQRGGPGGGNAQVAEVDGMTFTISGQMVTLTSIKVADDATFTIPDTIDFKGKKSAVTGFSLKANFLDENGKTLEKTVGQLCGHTFKKVDNNFVLVP